MVPETPALTTSGRAAGQRCRPRRPTGNREPVCRRLAPDQHANSLRPPQALGAGKNTRSRCSLRLHTSARDAGRGKRARCSCVSA